MPLGYFTDSTPLSPLRDPFNVLVDGVNAVETAVGDLEDRRAIQTFRWADASERSAQTGMVAGDEGFQSDTAIWYRYVGGTWKPWASDWITWTTAPTGITVGTGGSASSLQRYKYVDGKVLVQYKFVLGSTGASVGTAPYITLPFNLTNPVPRYAVLPGDGNLYDLSATLNFYSKHRVNDPSSNQVLISTYTGTFANITSSAPFTWGAGDILQGEFWIDLA